MGIEENIKPGSIVLLEVEFPHQRKGADKYLVVVTCDQKILLLKINSSSSQTEFGIRKREYQFKLKKEVYSFLNHDSYLDCGTVWLGIIDREEMVQQVLADPSRVKGELTKDHRNEVIRLTEKSRSISTVHKGIIRDKFSQ